MADANRKNMECKNVKKVEIKAQGSIPEEINKETLPDDLTRTERKHGSLYTQRLTGNEKQEREGHR